MSLTKSPLGVFLMASIILGGALDISVTFFANGVSCFLCGDVCACGSGRQQQEGVGTYVFTVYPGIQ